MNPTYRYLITMERWVDGDTFDAMVDLGFHISVAVRFRVLDLDTPERGQPNYAAARAMAEYLLPPGSEFVAESLKSEKYGRWLINLPEVSAGLRAAGLCKPVGSKGEV